MTPYIIRNVLYTINTFLYIKMQVSTCIMYNYVKENFQELDKKLRDNVCVNV